MEKSRDSSETRAEWKEKIREILSRPRTHTASHTAVHTQASHKKYIPISFRTFFDGNYCRLMADSQTIIATKK